MRQGEYLGNFEMMLLLALIRLGDNAYGVTIARELEAKSGREVILANVYAKLERLEEQGYVTSKIGDPMWGRWFCAGQLRDVDACIRSIHAHQLDCGSVVGAGLQYRCCRDIGPVESTGRSRRIHYVTPLKKLRRTSVYWMRLSSLAYGA